MHDLIIIIIHDQFSPDHKPRSDVTNIIIPGYANEVGEAFRHMVGVRWVYLTYLVSSSYVAAHALQQGVRASRPTSPHVYTSFPEKKKQY